MARSDLFEKALSHERLEQLNAARELDLLPYFRQVDGEPGPVVRMEGKERITLGSNNYLGLTSHPAVKQAARDALEAYGTGLTGSRFMNGTTPLHVELERELADWMGTEDAIVYTTGYQANVGCIATLLGPGDTVICDSGDHASILDAVSMARARVRPFRHNRLAKLEKMLERSESDGGGVLVVVDGVFSMEGDLAPLPDVVDLCRRHGARLMVDEAHGVGVLGMTGTGACEAYGVQGEVDLRMGTFSKSLASCGGYICGSSGVIDFLRVQSRAFMFTAAAVPAAVGAALGALRVIRSDEGRELIGRVLDNARYLQRGLAELGFDVPHPTPLPDGSDVLTPILPVPVGDDWRAVRFWKALFDAGVYANVALYPAVPRGGALLRTSVMATHEREHLDNALAAFERVRNSLPEDDGGPSSGAPDTPVTTPITH
ncbi:MAG: aminotransferase class I/II-fold pyridoxal phosphate-dependent enzyme [Thermoleophilaceae bacterium]